MLETPHVMVGAAIATKIPNPFVAIPLAFVSHLVLDRVPHWNPHFYTETQKYGKPTKKSTIFEVADSLLGLAVGLYFASRVLPDYGHAATIVAACLASVLSDQIKLPYFFLNIRTGFLKKWTDFERSIQANAPVIPGIITQVVVALSAYWWLQS